MARVLDPVGSPLPDADAVLERLGVVLTAVELPDDDDLAPAVAAAAAGDLAVLTALVDVPAETLAAMPTDVGAAKGVLVVDPDDPETEAQRAVFWTWHVNDAHELHLILSGDGSFWFAEADGPVAEVVLEPGDVIGITGTEHRYAARTPQAFLVRHSADGDMTPTPTGRP